MGRDRTLPPPEHGLALRWPGYVVAGLLAAAILLGGGGAEGPANNGLIYAASLVALLGLAVAHWRGIRPLGREAVLPLCLLAILLLIGAAQLVPLPPSIWHAMPGRGLARSALALTPAAGNWQPISLDPEATRRSMAALLLPAALMIAILGAGRREALLFTYVILACTLASGVVGVLQLALDYPSLLTFYDGPTAGGAGVFANSNHQAALLLAAIICVGLAAALRWQRQSERNSRRPFDPIWLLLPIFAVMTLATRSGAGSLLLVVAAPASLAIGLGWRPSRILPMALAALVVLVFAVSAVANRGGLVENVVASFGGRTAILPDVLFTLREYWPFGSGFGTFASAYAVNENLDMAGRQFVNHAHNDILELVAEAGIAGALWLALAVAAIAYRSFKVLSAKDSGRRHVTACCAGLMVLALLCIHSLVDYPVRMASIGAVAGIATGLLFAPFRTVSGTPHSLRSPRWPLILAGLAAVILGGQVLRIFIAQAAVRAEDGAASVAQRPQNGAGLALAAEEELAHRRNAQARTLANDSIAHAPFSARAARVLAIADDTAGRGGIQAWRVASAMGWRDSPTQFWAMQQAILNGEWATASIRADALMRTTGQGRAAAIAIVRQAATREPFRRELVRRLNLGPPWRRGFFAVAPDTPQPQLQGVIQVLGDPSYTRGRPPAEEAGRAIDALIQHKYYLQAVGLYRMIVGPEKFAAAMTDLSFHLGQPTFVTPFHWSFLTRDGSITGVEQSGDKRVLHVATNGRKSDQIVRKYLALATGSYRLQFYMRGPASSPADFGIAVYCAAGKEPLAVSSSDPLGRTGFERREMVFTVPENCPLLFIAIQAKGAGEATQAEFSELSLDAA